MAIHGGTDMEIIQGWDSRKSCEKVAFQLSENGILTNPDENNCSWATQSVAN
jgi:hypothetical protein